MVTSAVVQATPSHRYWVTDAALGNWREKIKNAPDLDDDKLRNLIDTVVVDAVKLGKAETIIDGDEPAQLIHINIGKDLFFALLKKSINPNLGATAVVAIMTLPHVEKKRATRWSKPGLKMGLSEDAKARLSSVKPTVPVQEKKLEAPQRPTPMPNQIPNQNLIPNPETKTFLISYIPIRNTEVRVYEEWSTVGEVEVRLTQVKIIHGTLRVYKELPVGYRILS